jgi:serine/threonine protein kinase
MASGKERTMTTTDPTRIAPNPSDSVLMTLARAAMAPDATFSESTWPRLDLNDPRQREFGDYELLEEIGRGGMGVVYRARQRSLDRDVAIKFIAAGIADSFNVARFLGEARAAARLLHPNIVPVHEVGSIDGVHYFSMPLIKGRTLASLLDDGVMKPETVIALMLKLCDAIGYAHRLGLLHLDLKPANVLLDERDEPLVTDFGLARHMDDGGGVDAQEVSGTPSFMAPEQILIKQYRLTPATDLYALGAILYRCLAGVSPHGEGRPDELTQRAVAGRVRPLRELNPAVPPDLAAIAMKCLELLPKDRYASVADLADDLRRVRDGLPVSVRRIGSIERARRWFQREPKLAFASIVAVATLLVGAAATTWQWRNATTQRDIALAAEAIARRERDRAEGSSQLGAWLYVQTYQSQQDNALAPRMLQWLSSRSPDNDNQHSDALTAFVRDLYALKPEATESIIWPLIGVLGDENRRNIASRLLAGHRPDRFALAARLTWYDETSSTEPRQFSALLDRAIEAQPEDVGVWTMAATFCTAASYGPICSHPEAADRLSELQPDNAFPWLLQAIAPDSGIDRAALHQAALRTEFEDNFRVLFGGYREAVTASGVKAPEIITDPLRIIAPDQPPELLVVLAESAPFPITGWQPLMNHCNPSKHSLQASDRSDCLAVGLLMNRSKGTLVTRHLGGIIVRRLAPGSELARAMLASRRDWLFVRESTFQHLSPRQRNNYPANRLLDDIVREGEMEAWSRRLEHYGLPSRPPASWQPEDPRDLMLPEEREAYDRLAGGHP